MLVIDYILNKNPIVYRFFGHNGEPLHESLILRLSTDIYTLYGMVMLW